jgi:glucokinase
VTETPTLQRWPALDGSVGREVLLAIDLGGTKTTVAVTGRHGALLAHTTIPTESEAGVRQVMDRVARAGHELLDHLGTRGESVAVASAVSPGIVFEDRVHLAPNNAGWETLGLRRELRSAFGAPVTIVDNDVKAAAQAEARWGRLAGVDTGVFLNLGTGLGLAVVVQGEVLRGANGAAGEIGYQLTGRAGEHPFAEGGAPLESLAGGRALAERVSALVGRAITTAEAFSLAEHDPDVAAVVSDALAVLARHIANVAVCVDPEVVVVAGGMNGSASRVLAALSEQLDRAVPYPPRLELAHFADDSALMGAVLLAVDAAAKAEAG